MALDDIPLKAVMPSPRFDGSVERLSRIQAEFVSEALKRAVDDAGAAMAHQLSEPLTALMLYLHEIKQAGEPTDGVPPAPALLRDIIDMALRETERVCDIVERVGKTVEAPVDAGAAIARGRDAISTWAWNSRSRTGGGASQVQPSAHLDLLTPREHEVLALITGGCSNKEGGYRLGISTRTFEAHRAHIMWKFRARNAADLMRKTLNRGE
jgi:DNA-binding CsgD family transcriptional regulator